MHKISSKDHIATDLKGEMNDVQVFIDMILDPEFWKQQKIVYVREKPVRDVLGIDGSYASFYDFIDNNSKYKLSRYAEEAFRKNPAQQNAFDKEIIRVDERLNVLLSVLNGTLLKVFPLKDSPNHLWVSFVDSLSVSPVNYADTMRVYFMSVYEATGTGDYSTADKLLSRIGTITEGRYPG